MSTDPSSRTATTISYSPNQLQAARTLQSAVPGARLVETEDTGSALLLTLGRTYDGIAAVQVKGTRSTSQTAATATADQDICTG